MVKSQDSFCRSLKHAQSGIISYLEIYIKAPVAVETIQRHCRHRSPMEIKNALSKQEDAGEIPAMSFTRCGDGRPFQTEGPVAAKALLGQGSPSTGDK